jgi:hypothetical protein
MQPDRVTFEPRDRPRVGGVLARFRGRERRDDCVASVRVAGLRDRKFNGVVVGAERSDDQVRGALKRAAQHDVGHVRTVGTGSPGVQVTPCARGRESSTISSGPSGAIVLHVSDDRLPALPVRLVHVPPVRSRPIAVPDLTFPSGTGLERGEATLHETRLALHRATPPFGYESMFVRTEP